MCLVARDITSTVTVQCMASESGSGDTVEPGSGDAVEPGSGDAVEPGSGDTVLLLIFLFLFLVRL